LGHAGACANTRPALVCVGNFDYGEEIANVARKPGTQKRKIVKGDHLNLVVIETNHGAQARAALRCNRTQAEAPALSDRLLGDKDF